MNIKDKYNKEIYDNEEIKKCKIKEIQDILDSNLDNKDYLINKLYNEIDDIEKNIVNLKLRLNEIDNENFTLKNNLVHEENGDIKNKKHVNIEIREINNYKNNLNIKEVENKLNENIKLIKDELDIIIKNNYNNETCLHNVVSLKMQLNKISSDLFLFKCNYIDCFKNINK
jgi:hypothetical protein